MPNLYFESVDIGDPVAPLTKPPVTRVQIARFAGASGDYTPLHIDDDFAKAAGYGGVFAHGGIALGFATEAVARWAENGRVLATQCKFQRLVWPGDILTAKGVVVAHYEREGEPRIDVDVWAENQNHDIVMKGQVTCVLWKDEKEEKKTKGVAPPAAPKTAARLRSEKEAAEKARAEKEAAEEAAEAEAKAAAKAKKKAARKKSNKKAAAKTSSNKKAAAKKKSNKKAAAKKKSNKKAAAKKKSNKKAAAKKKAPAKKKSNKKKAAAKKKTQAKKKAAKKKKK